MYVGVHGLASSLSLVTRGLIKACLREVNTYLLRSAALVKGSSHIK